MSGDPANRVFSPSGCGQRPHKKILVIFSLKSGITSHTFQTMSLSLNYINNICATAKMSAGPVYDNEMGIQSVTAFVVNGAKRSASSLAD